MKPDPIIAGIDMATQTGVAIGRPGEKPTFHTFDLGRGQSHEFRFASALTLAHTLIKEHGVEVVGMEQTLVVFKSKGAGRNDTQKNLALAMGCSGAFRAWMHKQSVPVHMFAVQSLDVNFLNGRSVGGRAQRKASNRQRCKQLQWTPSNDDEADAGSVWWSTCRAVEMEYTARRAGLV